jgi:hypothetical protein
MYIAGRWVSLELANTIFILWLGAVAVLGAIVWWMSRRRPPKSPAKEVVSGRRRGNRKTR